MPISEPTNSYSPATSIIPASHIHLLNEPATLGAPDAELPEAMQIKLVREGHTIRSIEVICRCGARLVLNCLYDHDIAANSVRASAADPPR